MTEKEKNELNAESIIKFLRIAPPDAINRVNDIVTGFLIAQEMQEEVKGKKN